MKRLIYTATLTLAIASFNFCVQATTIKASEPFVDIVNAVQFPKIVKPSNANVVRQSFSLWIPQTSNKISEVILNIPPGLNVRKDITVSDNSQINLQAGIAIDGKKIVITFPQPVSSGTTLNVSLNEVNIHGISNGWDYPVKVKFVGINTDIPVGIVQFGVY
jgi:hypothetical protein|uniref:DUF2808 domain-containing protein n=1 Tax=Aetokthonos hydrillicola Thurmond2011 TaxID=2712845 RepID=A0AAP5MA72_9CYAN|nr:hypothetical protein [Aetokthonos hydrillicola]MBO3458390.1 hypothetical protein [Aetokthonos hydrillicola CCALA 1050]MBW4586070.1 hypothetical protein [Aetokthonos hydrillicola CCALA 1050]MDR9897890.1 hypothetical protein [Aetokthonos hydrillicola Thurmond2011]